MTDVHLTDDTEMASRLEAQTRAALALGEFITPDLTERAVALLTAATTLLEREMGAGAAAEGLLLLIEPTVAGWQAAGAVRH